MPPGRREFLNVVPIFDLRPVFGLAEQRFPGKGAELSNAWRTDDRFSMSKTKAPGNILAAYSVYTAKGNKGVELRSESGG